MRTAAQIARQVEGLRAMKSTLPEFSTFGDPNWESIDAQIEILEGRETAEDYEDEHETVASSARDAEDWLTGYSDDDLFDSE